MAKTAFEYACDELRKWFESSIEDKELMHRISFYKRKKLRNEME